MAFWGDIIGQDRIKDYYQKVLINGNVSHAYIIEGERGAQREQIAEVVAKTLQCENRIVDGDRCEPCGKCRACKQADAMSHMDIIHVTHEKPNTISSSEVRQQICGDVDIKPYSGNYKVYIINDADKLEITAQNALLKTLEEPPNYVVILLLVSNQSTLLETILSRVVLLRLQPVDGEVIANYLRKELRVDEDKINLFVAYARGDVGRAKQIAQDEKLEGAIKKMIKLLITIKEVEVMALDIINSYEIDINEFLDMITIWYRDVLMFKATNDVNSLVFKDEFQAIKKMADMSAYEGIENINNAIENARKRLEAKVDEELTIRLLLLAIREN